MLVEDSISRRMGVQHELLEKPSGVGQVPFGWAGIVHGLHSCIGIRQSFRQPQSLISAIPQRPSPFGVGSMLSQLAQTH
jgi:hypothetical protein